MKYLIKGKTPSVNHLYGHNKFGSVYMKPEAKKIRIDIIKDVELQANGQGFNFNEWSGRLLKVITTIFEDWYTKKNTVKKKDVANREKFLIDSIMLGLGLDDQFIWEHTMRKSVVDTEEEYHSEVEIEYYKP